MAKKKSKKQLEEEAFEELKRRAVQPFKPNLTMEDVLKHEQEVREESFAAAKRMRKELSEEKKKNILSRADFEQPWQ